MKRYICVYCPNHTERLHRLAIWAVRFTPFIGVDDSIADSPGLILDVSGTERVHGSYLELLNKIQDGLEECKVSARICLAPTLGGAWALSRFGKHTVTLCDKSALVSSLKPLPTQALRISSEIEEGLRLSGINFIGELLSLPRDSIGLRFGNDLLIRLDQALGLSSEVFRVITLPEPIEVSRAFETPLTHHESVLRTVSYLLGELFKTMRRRRRVAQSLTVTFDALTETGAPQQLIKELSLALASSDQRHIDTLLQALVEPLHFEGGVRAIKLTVVTSDKAYDRQAQLIPADAAANSTIQADLKDSLAQLLDNYTVRLGKHGTRRMQVRESFIPERAYKFATCQSAPLSVPTRALHADRPTQLLPRPEPIEVIALMPDKTPARITWRGKRQRVLNGLGPERIAPEWWHTQGDTTVRDYFKLQNEEGNWLWVFRDAETQRWFVQGVWV